MKYLFIAVLFLAGCSSSGSSDNAEPEIIETDVEIAVETEIVDECPNCLSIEIEKTVVRYVDFSERTVDFPERTAETSYLESENAILFIRPSGWANNNWIHASITFFDTALSLTDIVDGYFKGVGLSEDVDFINIDIGTHTSILAAEYKGREIWDYDNNEYDLYELTYQVEEFEMKEYFGEGKEHIDDGSADSHDYHKVVISSFTGTTMLREAPDNWNIYNPYHGLGFDPHHSPIPTSFIPDDLCKYIADNELSAEEYKIIAGDMFPDLDEAMLNGLHKAVDDCFDEVEIVKDNYGVSANGEGYVVVNEKMAAVAGMLGIKEGDTVTSVNGYSMEELMNNSQLILDLINSGDGIEITYACDSQEGENECTNRVGLPPGI